MLKKLLLLAVLPVFLIATLGRAGSANAEESLNASQKKEVEKVVQDYITNNPEVLIQALQKYRIDQQNAEQEQARDNLQTLTADLNDNPASPYIGNKDGDVTVVEFFDYRCGYCKKVFPTIETLLKEDGNIRYVLKEFPILGPASVIASQASLAVWNSTPDKYMDFHTALMTARGQLNEDRIFAMAEDLGIDTAVLRKTMNGDAVTQELNKNMKLAKKLGINGTPAFVIGSELAPGAVSIDELKRLVALARKG